MAKARGAQSTCFQQVGSRQEHRSCFMPGNCAGLKHLCVRPEPTKPKIHESALTHSISSTKVCSTCLARSGDCFRERDLRGEYPVRPHTQNQCSAPPGFTLFAS